MTLYRTLPLWLLWPQSQEAIKKKKKKKSAPIQIADSSLVTTVNPLDHSWNQKPTDFLAMALELKDLLFNGSRSFCRRQIRHLILQQRSLVLHCRSNTTHPPPPPIFRKEGSKLQSGLPWGWKVYRELSRFYCCMSATAGCLGSHK